MADLKLWLVRHRGFLEVEDIIAEHSAMYYGEQITETLIEGTAVEAAMITSHENVLNVKPAPLGLFNDDTEGAVLVHADGTWEVMS